MTITFAQLIILIMLLATAIRR